MQPIVFRKAGRLYRIWKDWSPWSNFSYGEDDSVETDLCSLVSDLLWTVFVAVLLFVLVAVVLWGLVILPIKKLGVLVWLFCLGAAAGIVGLVWLGHRWYVCRPERPDRHKCPSEFRLAVRAWIVAKKGKYCPKVEFR